MSLLTHEHELILKALEETIEQRWSPITNAEVQVRFRHLREQERRRP